MSTGVLDTCLMTITITESLTTVLLTLVVPEILTLTYTQYSVLIGFVASIITLPLIVKIKCLQICYKIQKCAKYVVYIKAILVLASLGVHIVALLSIFVTFFIVHQLDFNKSLTAIMKNYATKKNCKTVVDDIQNFLQCCGAQGYMDWFTLEWVVFDYSYSSLVNNADKNVINPDGAYHNKSVPYSCCSRASNTTCNNFDVVKFGAASINVRGCAPILKKYVFTMLYGLMIIYGINCLFHYVLLTLIRYGIRQASSKATSSVDNSNKSQRSYGESSVHWNLRTEAKLKFKNIKKSIEFPRTKKEQETNFESAFNTPTTVSAQISSLDSDQLLPKPKNPTIKPKPITKFSKFARKLLENIKRKKAEKEELLNFPEPMFDPSPNVSSLYNNRSLLLKKSKKSKTTTRKTSTLNNKISETSVGLSAINFKFGDATTSDELERLIDETFGSSPKPKSKKRINFSTENDRAQDRSQQPIRFKIKLKNQKS